MEKDVAMLKQLVRWPIFSKDTQIEQIEKKTKPGVHAKIKDEVLFGYRDGLTFLLDAFWPWMEERLYKASSPNSSEPFWRSPN